MQYRPPTGQQCVPYHANEIESNKTIHLDLYKREQFSDIISVQCEKIRIDEIYQRLILKENIYILLTLYDI